MICLTEHMQGNECLWFRLGSVWLLPLVQLVTAAFLCGLQEIQSTVKMNWLLRDIQEEK
jgi:hypothetical protein